MACILIIDDSAFTRRQLKKVLDGLDYEVIEAGSGAEGLLALESRRPDCVVTDLLMPEMDGFGFIAAVRQRQDELKSVPIIVLSADVQDTSRSKTVELGANGFINKPVRADMVRATLASTMNRTTTLDS